MRRILRVGMLAASLFGVVATVAPMPADATTEGSLTIAAGVATVSGHGIAYPLVNSDGSGVDLSKTPDHFSNSASVHFESTTAIGAETTTKKPLPVQAGSAIAVADGWIHGYCDISEGTLHGTTSIAVLLSGSQHYSFSLSWVAVGGQLVVTGHVHKHGTQHSGPLEGSINAIPVTGSCFNKFEKNFAINGGFTFTLLSTPLSLPHVTIPKTSVHI